MHTVVDEIQYWGQVTVRHTPQVYVGIGLFLCISEGSFEEVRAENHKKVCHICQIINLFYFSDIYQADRITLWACKVLAPESVHARVTSKKSLSALRSLNAPETFSAKSFHRRQKLSVLVAPMLIWWQLFHWNFSFTRLHKFWGQIFFCSEGVLQILKNTRIVKYRARQNVSKIHRRYFCNFELTFFTITRLRSFRKL